MCTPVSVPKRPGGSGPSRSFSCLLVMQRKSLWGSYKSLHPRTRIWIGVGGMAFATFGMLISDYLENQFPATEREKSQAAALSPIIVVDHKDE
ncbi:hypothetical protein BX666DRAFT_1883612 [Dichotomocladium elegans]|nr:hypothetical protein BX666DRAFT_1883612 [Dichotomocladium elegans]